jgi:hypothetical protein
MLGCDVNHNKMKMKVKISTFRSPIPGQRASSSIEASMIRESDCKYTTHAFSYIVHSLIDEPIMSNATTFNSKKAEYAVCNKYSSSYSILPQKMNQV